MAKRSGGKRRRRRARERRRQGGFAARLQKWGILPAALGAIISPVIQAPVQALVDRPPGAAQPSAPPLPPDMQRRLQEEQRTSEALMFYWHVNQEVRAAGDGDVVIAPNLLGGGAYWVDVGRWGASDDQRWAGEWWPLIAEMISHAAERNALRLNAIEMPTRETMVAEILQLADPEVLRGEKHARLRSAVLQKRLHDLIVNSSR